MVYDKYMYLSGVHMGLSTINHRIPQLINHLSNFSRHACRSGVAWHQNPEIPAGSWSLLRVRHRSRAPSWAAKESWSTLRQLHLNGCSWIPIPEGNQMGVSENSVPLKPLVNDHYPYETAISLGIYPTFSDKAIWFIWFILKQSINSFQFQLYFQFQIQFQF